VIFVVWNVVSREIFFQGDKVEEPKLRSWNPTMDQVKVIPLFCIAHPYRA